MAPIDPAQAVQLARIRMALRRATGRSVDVEALLLGAAAQAAASIKEWRALGAADLNLLLDHWVAEASAGAGGAAPVPAKAAGAAPTPAPADPPPDPPDLKPPPDRRYLRGAR